MGYRRNSNPGANPNKNVNWIGDSFYAFFIALIFLFHAALWVLPFFPRTLAWTVVHVLLTLTQLYFFHWVKGTPFWGEDSGEYDNLTFWEQIDDGVQNTKNRKVLTAIPVVVFLLACYECNWDHTLTTFNLVVFLFAIVPKLGFMHRTRLAGINR